MSRITTALVRGYGLSFRDGTRLEKDGLRILSGKEKKATLHLVIQDEGITYPIMVDEKNEATMALAFYVYLPEIGWQQVDLVRLCQSWAEEDGDLRLKIQLREATNADTTKFEKIKAGVLIRLGGESDD